MCEKCMGSGLIGNGPNPHLRVGAVKVCDICKGTGKIEDASVDNTDETGTPKKGIMSKIFGKK